MAIRSSAVACLSLDFIVAPPIQVSRSFRSRRSHPRQQGPQQPTRSGRSLFPATPMISGTAIAVGYRLRREVDPSESRLKPRRMPEAYLSPPTYLAIPRRGRRDVGHFRRVIDGAPRMPVGARTNQTERCTGACPPDCVRELSHTVPVA